MKVLILLLLFSLTATAMAGKKIVDLNVDSGIFDFFSDQVVITRDLYSETKDLGSFLYFKNNNCKLLGLHPFLGQEDIPAKSRHDLHSKKVKYLTLPEEWFVALVFNRLDWYRTLICSFPSDQFKNISEITTDHITNATDGIIVFD